MKFSELKVDDCFYIEENGNKIPFRKTVVFESVAKSIANLTYDIFLWNSVSLINDSRHLKYCNDDLEVFPFDEDGFY